MFQLREPYHPRSIRFLDLWTFDDWRLKVYGIAYRGERPRPELVEAARLVVREFLGTNRTRQTTYGVGFIGIHDGRGENQVFLDRWCNENELLHDYWVSPTDRPAQLIIPETDHNSVCVWDVAVQCAEREAWVQCVLESAQPDIEAYLSRRLNADI